MIIASSSRSSRSSKKLQSFNCSFRLRALISTNQKSQSTNQKSTWFCGLRTSFDRFEQVSNQKSQSTHGGGAAVSGGGAGEAEEEQWCGGARLRGMIEMGQGNARHGGGDEQEG
ncbi:hypothetical protein U1Q18_003725 [Sarracenia purpurea var. burkii]